MITWSDKRDRKRRINGREVKISEHGFVTLGREEGILVAETKADSIFRERRDQEDMLFLSRFKHYQSIKRYQVVPDV